MQTLAPAQLDAIFYALCDQTRRGILARLRRGPATVGELAQGFGHALPTISKHLSVLRSAGLLRSEPDPQDRRAKVCALEREALEQAQVWIRHHQAFWNDKLDALERYVTLPDVPAPKKKRGRP